MNIKRLLCLIGLHNKQASMKFYPDINADIITHGIFVSICHHCGKKEKVFYNYIINKVYSEEVRKEHLMEKTFVTEITKDSVAYEGPEIIASSWEDAKEQATAQGAVVIGRKA